VVSRKTSGSKDTELKEKSKVKPINVIKLASNPDDTEDSLVTDSVMSEIRELKSSENEISLLDSGGGDEESEEQKEPSVVEAQVLNQKLDIFAI
jgi:hypothetical protein